MQIKRVYNPKGGRDYFYVLENGVRISMVYLNFLDALEFVARQDEKGRIEENAYTANKNRILRSDTC